MALDQVALTEKETDLLTTHVGVKGNVRAITIADFNLDHLSPVLDVVERMYDFWAYIIHDKDTDTEPHYHLLAIQKGGTTLANHISFFADILPANFILKVKNPRACAKYMIHKGWNTKYQYLADEVFSSDKGRYISMLDSYTNSNCLWSDYRAVRAGRLKIEDFISRYQAEFACMPFYQKMQLFAKLDDLSGANYSVTSHGKLVKRRSKNGHFSLST